MPGAEGGVSRLHGGVILADERSWRASLRSPRRWPLEGGPSSSGDCRARPWHPVGVSLHLVVSLETLAHKRLPVVALEGLGARVGVALLHLLLLGHGHGLTLALAAGGHERLALVALLVPGLGVARLPVAKGDILIVGTYVVQRDARWFEEPESFRPERWEGDLARRLPRFAYFPFGGGPRQCIGNGFAQMEAVLILATVAQRFRLSLVPGQRITPTPYVTLRPEPGIRLLVAGR